LLSELWRTPGEPLSLLASQFPPEFPHSELFEVCGIRSGAFSLSVLRLFFVRIAPLGQLTILVLESCECRYFSMVAKWEICCGIVQALVVAASEIVLWKD